MTGPGTNTYLVGHRDVVVVDPGPADDDHLERIAAAAGTIRYVVVTHSHRDHAPGAGPLARAAGATLLGFGERPNFSPDGRIAEGDVVVADAWRLEALHTPGHSSDHLCFVATTGPGPRVLFSGDHVMEGSTVVVGPPDGDMAAYLASLRRVRDLDPAIDVIAPGHGILIADPHAAVDAYLDLRARREAAVVAALAGGARHVDGLVAELYPSIADGLRRHAGRSVWAHLRKLGAEGRAISADPDDPDASWELVSS